jgi:hypothetical protein
MSESARPALPAWARALDGLAIAFALISATVALTGGFRELTPIGRMSVTSALRPLILAALIVAFRHWKHRQPALPSIVVTAMRRFWRSADTRVIWPVFWSTRLGVLVIGFLGIAVLGYAPGTPPWRVYENDLLNLPARWDTGWYLGIAENGYAWDPAQSAHMQNIAFFPAYPLLIRYSSLFLARQRAWAAVAISFVSFFLALRYLLRLARASLDDDAAATAVALLAAYPFAFFYSAAYTESLFLLTAVATCYHFERDERWQAALWGLAAGLARPNGCLLSVVLALMVARTWRTRASGALAARLAVAAAPGIGMLAYSVYIYTLTGHPLEWAANHAAYGRVYRGIGALVADRVQYIQINGFYNYISVLSLDLINAIPIVFALACVWPVYRRFGVAFAAMIVLNVLPPLLMGGVLSMGRVTATLFPIFLWLGATIPSRHRPSWLMTFSMGQALGAIAFFTWRPLV